MLKNMDEKGNSISSVDKQTDKIIKRMDEISRLDIERDSQNPICSKVMLAQQIMHRSCTQKYNRYIKKLVKHHDNYS